MNHNLTGEELYGLYVANLLRIQNCSTASWDQLEEEDKQVWNETAWGLIKPF